MTLPSRPYPQQGTPQPISPQRIVFTKGFTLYILLAPLIILAALVALKLADVEQYWEIIREDGPVEYLSSIAYFFASFIAFSIGWGFRRRDQRIYRILYMALAAGFLFIGLEEISYGQRLFGIETPEAFADNIQGEMNLHNFATQYILHGAYILIGAYGAFVPLLVSKNISGNLRALIDLFVPGRLLFFYFLPAFLLYIYYDYLSIVLVYLFGPEFGYARNSGGTRFMIGKDQEGVELLLAMGFLLFVWFNKWRQNAGEFDGLHNRSLAEAIQRKDAQVEA